MRTCSIALLLAIPLMGQPTPVPLPSFGNDRTPALFRFLGVSAVQEASIQAELRSGFFPADLYERRRELEREIYEETARSPLRPADLGRLHVEWETIRRSLHTWEKQRAAAARALLTNAQREKLDLIEQIAAEQLYAASLSVGLSPDNCSSPLVAIDPSIVCSPPLIPSINAIPDWGPRPDDEGRLQRFLSLTPELEQRFDDNRTAIWARTELDRLRTVLREIREETARETLDPLALGLRYAEVESIRRNESDRARELVMANNALLSAAQKEKLNVLKESIRLQDNVRDATSDYLLGRRCRNQVVLFASREPLSGVGALSYYEGDCPDRRALDELP